MTDYRKRLLEEKEQLQERLQKLNSFIKTSSVFKGLSPLKQYLLKRQSAEMDMYLNTLSVRIDIEENGESVFVDSCDGHECPS
ncbi:MAG: hypothetical protein Q4A09_04935 [Capnocytophaga felis]|nr:hypothetical protein [Capnocytophaga felis]